MSRSILILAVALMVVGFIGVIAVTLLPQTQTAFYPSSGYNLPYGGMSGPGMMGSGMMQGRRFGYGYPTNAAPLTLDQAVTRAQQYVASLNSTDLALVEVMEFSNHLYARIKEKSTGVNAFEILMDKYSGAIAPEPGPNMMWNAKYSPMSNMMGGWFASSAQNIVTPTQAKEKAQQYLDTYLKGAKVADDADAFYGYYTMDVERDGKTIGMLSVNGTSGTVWYHTWHGSFVSEKEIE